MKNIRVALVSLGCAKNLVDSEIMLSLLQTEGFVLVAKLDDAEAIIVNTCGFIDSAKEESIEKILEMACFKQGNCRVLLAAGCLAQRFGTELLAEIPELDGIFGINDVHGAAEAVRRVFAGERPALLQGEYRPPEDAARLLATPAHTAYLKIAEGCDNKCTYCAIPAIRGPYRSKDRQTIVAEAKKLAAGGVKEVNLIAQDITLFGLDRTGQLELPALLEELTAIPELSWIRLLYAYPERLNKQIVEAVARLDKVCNYLDLPLQHGSDRILRRMGRKTTAKKNIMLLNSLREQIPGITLRSSFIVGFPGEDEADFQALLDFLQEARLERVGFFAYSREAGTPAARFYNQVSNELKEERVARALSLQSRIGAEKQKLLIGRMMRVMVDGRSAQERGLLLARSAMQAPEVDGYIRLQDNGAKNGEFLQVEITGFDGYDQEGKILNS
ncbi:MAG: 30S ribosomal protein S12 methylthiotransferase RimO [Dethiobacter sp.]|jgi:ribosomal protein S12 methylthiotransferase|nr:30S ribosomal protein S12 methylthiotransferase RimO [Dethiobacter sp.]MBS3900693.1 30S ribosomal protein S12 methylthiotransferase RimO [Dethiobacter sp.]MBS3990327.1 30S ribosomal protein S12 methylthiotransferase RimO [Dethiobacter sp.]